MKRLSYLFFWAVLGVAAAMAFGPAHAANFDGGWSVSIVTTKGSCAPRSGFHIQISGGSIVYGGGASVSGRVSPSGAVTVQVSAGGQSAGGSGKLRGNSGGGSWRGSGSGGACSGRWSASRG